MRIIKDINFNWKYTDQFKEEYIGEDFDDSYFSEVNIPHSNIEVPFNNFPEEIYQFESCYRKSLWLDKWHDDEMVFIHFEGVMTYAKVYLNGQYLGEHKGGYTGFRIDLTPAARAEDYNLLAVYVDSRERSDIPPFGHVVDYMTFGGIYREVSLEYCHKVYIESSLIKGKDLLSETPLMEVDLHLKNSDGRSGVISCSGELVRDNRNVLHFTTEIALSGNENQLHRFNCSLENIELWDIENPALYHLNLTLTEKGKETGKYSYRCGFRDISYRPDGFFLNGRKIKIRGLNRHQTYPYAGNAMPKSAQYKDAEILKEELGVNTVRLSHYPQSRHFLDRCDELGLLVFDEIPGWQHIGDDDWKKISLKNVEEMIKTDGNHPSIFIWGVRINESQDDDEFYAKTNDLARSLDNSRPTGGVRCFPGSRLLEDVYTYNDFNHSGKNAGLIKRKKAAKSKVPYLVTEHNGHMFPSKKFDNEKHRTDQAKRHLTVLDWMYGDSEISGAIGWSMFDYYTHQDFGSGDKICYHGVMDMFRIPKNASFAYASQQDENPVMYISSSMNIGENEGSLLGDVYIFTNCDSVKMYKGGSFVKEFYPRRDLYPHLPHPPVVIDDFLGDAIEKNETFSRRNAAVIKELMTKISREGYSLGLIDTIRMGLLFLKTGMNYKDAEDLYTKYFGGWGGAANSYTFEGFIDGECVKRVEKNQNALPRLVLSVDKTELREEETWDCTRCIVSLADSSGNIFHYGNDAFQIETTGPIEVIGPETIALVGGSVGFWLKTRGEEGQAQVKIHSGRFGTIEENLNIEVRGK
ncbi:MAG: glycoside hydrolase family 2 protein [Spirochaetales bacterium]|nr:glycoside hydrolase family 2 protein [Spirochaetales bacterium]